LESIAPQSEAIAAEASAQAPAGLRPATLAAFAAFVRDQQLEDYVRLQLEAAKGLDLPMLRRMQDIPQETLVAYGMDGEREFLTFLTEDRGREFVELSLSRWRQDALVLIGKLHVEVEDITGLNLVRKRVLGMLLPHYTTDLTAALAILSELDAFVRLQETASLNQLTLLHQEVAASRQEFIERVSATVPGALYVYDIARQSIQYVNPYLQALLGYTAQEFDALHESAMQLIHPDDAQAVADYFRDLSTLQDGEVRSCKYRCIHKNGSVLWLRSYNTPFRNSVDGALQQVVGFSFNITAEKLASEALKEREAQMLEAQAIARVGSYVQDLATGMSTGTPQMKALLGTENLNDWEAFFSRVHPDDRAEMKRALNQTHERGVPYHQTYRYADGAGGWKALTARGIIEQGADGKPATFRGTVQDVTEQQQLLDEVTEKSRLYREAQTVARMGSWSYELGSDEIYWSDELLYIYGLDESAGHRKRSEMRMYTLEEDRERASDVLDNAAASGEDEFEIRYRIRTTKGELKYLHSRGTFVRNAAGRFVRVMGTVQDITEQQALIDRLAESTQRYKEAQAIAELGSWTVNIHDESVQWSEQMYRLLDLPVDDPALSVRSFYSRAHPQDRAGLEDFFARMMAAPGEYTYEYRYRPAAGGLRWLSIRGESVADAPGKPTLLRGVVQNITAQREAAERLRQQEAFIRKVTDLAPSIITVYDVHSDAYEFVSRGITTLMGYTPEAVLEGGQPFLTTRIHPDDVAARTATNAAMASESPAPGTPEAVHEFRHRVRDAYGQYRWLHVFSTVFHRGYSGAAEKILSIAQDITERVAAEAVAREGERFVRNVTELVPSVITVTDVDTMKFVFINENGAAILGQPVQRFYDEGSAALASLVHPEDESVFYASLERALREAAAPQAGAAEPVSEAQYRVRGADGEYRWMRALTTPFMRRADGSIQQLISITQDVTPLHQAEELLRQRATMLQQSNQSLEEFAYVASHDLQEPLRKISTFGEMLQKSAANYDERSATFLTKIIESARRMQTLINDLLDISVISRQKGFETVSLNAVLREVLQTLEHKLESTGGTVGSSPLPDAKVVPAQMRQLFQNLLSNSLKFARPGVPPRITVESRVMFGREVQELGLPPHGAYARITLTDNGIGFSNEYADKIFTIFQRLHGKSEYEGSGIGLAICKKIAEHHGGTIFASGRSGEGATFTVVLPV